jgi:hypothetical protein
MSFIKKDDICHWPRHKMFANYFYNLLQNFFTPINIYYISIEMVAEMHVKSSSVVPIISILFQLRSECNRQKLIKFQNNTFNKNLFNSSRIIR